MDSFSEFMLIVPNINSSASGDDESYADDGPCNVKATNCTFNGMEIKLKNIILTFFSQFNAVFFHYFIFR